MAVITVSYSDLKSFVDLSMEDVEKNLTLIGIPVEGIEGDDISLEITPDRPDFLSVEGIARALYSFTTGKAREYFAAGSDYRIDVDPSVKDARPYIGAAVVKSVSMDEKILDSLIQVQEKLHDTLGRKRKKVAIGIHNLAPISFPLKYQAVGGESYSFVPLEKSEKMTMHEILQRHEKGQEYSHLVNGKFPLITDSSGECVSFPPIINADRTKLDESTNGLLIEVTGTSKESVESAVNILSCALADRGGQLFSVEINGKMHPNLKMEERTIPFKQALKLLDTFISKKQMGEMLAKMGYKVDGEKIYVPPYRTDVLHDVDVIEDIAIAYDYNKFEPSLPDFFTPGKRNDSNSLHSALTGLAFNEVVTWTLTNPSLMERCLLPPKLVEIANPRTSDFTHVRSTLLPNLLAIFSQSKDQKLPQKIYELGVCAEPQLKNHLGSAVMDSAVSFSDMKSYLDSIMGEMSIEYEIDEGQHPVFLKGRCAKISVGGKKKGYLGEVHPQVLNNLGIEQPVCAFEIEME